MRIFADALACADEKQQAQFLNDFALSLRAVCKAGHGWDTQVCFFSRYLDRTTIEVLQSVVKYAESHQEDARINHAKLTDVRSELWRIQAELSAAKGE